MSGPGGKRRIAVLGGGVGSMSAVWALTQLPDWQERFEITVYQQGWRLGGKGASGRNRRHGERIEEHGLHVWGGFYENAFRLIRQCYAELPRLAGPDEPLQRWDQAFRKKSAVILEEEVDGRWVSWSLDVPEDDGVPGDGGVLPSPWEYLQLLVGWLEELVRQAFDPAAPAGPGRLDDRLERWLQAPLEGLAGLEGLAAHEVLAGAVKVAALLAPGAVTDRHGLLLALVAGAVNSLEKALRSRAGEAAEDLRRLLVIVDLGLCTLRGLILDGVLVHGFQVINHLDWVEWLRLSGARQETLDSALVRGVYDYVFGFIKGDTGRPSLEAGTALHGVLRLVLTYKGALFYEMQAGMGDVVFGPLYRVLRERGVQFRFFHKVTALRLSADRRQVERIDCEEQATVKDGAEYQPLVTVQGLPCWPSQPRFDQLEQGRELEARGINLESRWSGWTGTPRTLERGRDFDDVVVGIAVGALGEVAAELAVANDRFAEMIRQVATAQTCSLQLWMDRTAEELGAPTDRPIGTAYAQPLNTWADMTHLLPRERWAPATAPRFLTYLCGPFADAPHIPGPEDHGFPARELARFRRETVRWLEDQAGHLWRRTSTHGRKGFDWELLHDDSGQSGEHRLDAQYLRVNLDPSERYVLSVPGSSRHRLGAGESGFDNVVLAGDWVRTAINAGCVEAAVMAGLEAARVVSGDPIEIIGEGPATPRRPRKKVAVLGGGCGAMTAAYYLSSTPELREALEVTVYQMGWRLGGKGASGRNAEVHERIEEHGLHVWSGFYHNAFHLMQLCYGQLRRPRGPIQTWTDAFKPHPRVAWEEEVNGEWRHWIVDTPVTTDVPGVFPAPPSPLGYLEMMVGWLEELVHELLPEKLGEIGELAGQKHALAGLLSTVFSWLARLPLLAAPVLLGVAERHGRRQADPGRRAPLAALEKQMALLPLRLAQQWLQSTVERFLDRHDGLRRTYILADLLLTLLKGYLADGIIVRGFMAIDDEDLVGWLRRHGASELTLGSAPVRAYYDYFFAYEDGDTSRPRMSAGVGLHHLLRLLGTYKGAFFWKMQSGMGDAVFAPLHELCRRNGVRFRFFHQVEELEPSADGKSIASVRVARQVDLIDEEYRPLIDVKGVPSWPSAPLDSQIVPAQREELRRRHINLEDPASGWDPVGRQELRAGRDYDALVLGIPIGALGSICSRLGDVDPAWRTMVARLPTIQTLALQLWFRPDAEGLGWVHGNVTGSGYGHPFESWSDMSEAIPREAWDFDPYPGNVTYFCGPMRTSSAPPSGADPAFGERQTREAERQALQWCRRYLGHIYRGAVKTGQPHELDWNSLVDPREREGLARFAAQYVRANYTPSERYVLDLPGTSRDRMEADTSGFDNLALAGDWLFTGLGGAVESAVMTGMQAARALTGHPWEIYGEMQSPWRRRVSVRRLL